MKSLNIDIIFPWEIGLILAIIGLSFIIIGVRQSKNKIDDLDKIILIKPTTKIFFGGMAIIFGGIQLLPLLK